MVHPRDDYWSARNQTKRNLLTGWEGTVTLGAILLGFATFGLSKNQRAPEHAPQAIVHHVNRGLAQEGLEVAISRHGATYRCDSMQGSDLTQLGIGPDGLAYWNGIPDNAYACDLYNVGSRKVDGESASEAVSVITGIPDNT